MIGSLQGKNEFPFAPAVFSRDVHLSAGLVLASFLIGLGLFVDTAVDDDQTFMCRFSALEKRPRAFAQD